MGDGSPFLFGWLFLTLLSTGVGLLLVLVSSGSLHRVGDEIALNPRRTLIVSAASLIVMPTLFLALCLTLIGVPLALLLLVVGPLLALYGLFALALLAGGYVLDLLGRRDAGDFWQMVAGVVAIMVALVLLRPVAWLLLPCALLLGFGTVAASMWSRLLHRQR